MTKQHIPPSNSLKTFRESIKSLIDAEFVLHQNEILREYMRIHLSKTPEMLKVLQELKEMSKKINTRNFLFVTVMRID